MVPRVRVVAGTPKSRSNVVVGSPTPEPTVRMTQSPYRGSTRMIVRSRFGEFQGVATAGRAVASKNETVSRNVSAATSAPNGSSRTSSRAPRAPHDYRVRVAACTCEAGADSCEDAAAVDIPNPGSPWQNAWIESFNGRLREEFLNGWQFDNLLEAQVLIEDWRVDYNNNRPHSAHGDLTPGEFARAWTTQDQPVLA